MTDFQTFWHVFPCFWLEKWHFFAFCCHAATLLPRSEEPLNKCILKDSWQRGSKIGNFIFFLPEKINFLSEKNKFRSEKNNFRPTKK